MYNPIIFERCFGEKFVKCIYNYNNLIIISHTVSPIFSLLNFCFYYCSIILMKESITLLNSTGLEYYWKTKYKHCDEYRIVNNGKLFEFWIFFLYEFHFLVPGLSDH
ncbi:Protein of unknown function [Gryllus bimaculatus]|nr:Protein of unknown function [Gryllus bimaculatus]